MAKQPAGSHGVPPGNSSVRRDPEPTMVPLAELLIAGNPPAEIGFLRDAWDHLQRRERQQAALAGLAQAALSRIQLSSLYEMAAHDVAQALEVELCGVFEIEAGGRELRLRAGVGWEEGTVGRAGIALADGSHADLALQSHAPVTAHSESAEFFDQVPQLLSDHATVSGITAPIGTGEGSWGILMAHSRCERVFSAREIEFVQAVANVLWQAIRNARHEHALKDDATRRRQSEDALRDSEARLASFLQNSATAAWMKDEQGRYVYVSGNLEQRFNTPDGWLRKTDAQLWPASVCEQLQANDQAVLDGGHAIEFEEELVDRQGNHSWWLVHKFPFQDSEGMRYIGGLAVDITARRQSEQELTTARIAAEAANEAKSQFLANVSHEIRTPMTAILGYADILASHLHDPDDQVCVQTIRRHGTYLCDILNDILDLSKMEAGKLSIISERCELLPILADVHSMMAVRAHERGLSLDITFESAVPKIIQSDSKRLRQILVNLVGNAIKFTREGHVRIAVGLVPQHQQLQLAVTDTGIGIEDCMKQRLFRPFEQVDSSLTREIGGTGLGLAISKRLAEMLGGDISVESELHKGSTFCCTIATGPLDESEWIVPNVADITGRPLSDSQASDVRLSCRVLVVDDRRDVRYLAQHHIESAGGRVVFANDGREALQRVKASASAENRIDVILMDMQMPVMDGYDATMQLRNSGFTGPIIALTAHAMVGDREKCLQAGCDGYLSKPLDRNALLQTLAAHAGRTGPRSAGRPDADCPSTNPGAGRPARVLLVDDSLDICRMLKLYLEGKGHHIRIASNAAEALSAVEQEVPDVIVLDLGLPGVSGAEVIGDLKSRPDLRHCRFLCLSGRRRDEVGWREMGFDEYLQKPADVQHLERLIRAHRA